MKALYCLVIILCSYVHISAQGVKTKVSLDASTLVFDSTGMQYPYAIWTKLLQTGEFSVKKNSITSDTFYLYQLNPAEKEKRKSIALSVKPPESKFFVTGDKFTTFKTTDIDKKKINLNELQSKIVVINFWFIDCPPCRAEIPQLNKIVNQYKDNNNVVFLAIALDDKSSLKEFLKASPYNYDIIDDGRWLAMKYGVNLFPTHVIVDPAGNIRFHTSGFGSGTVAWIEKTINELLQQKNISSASVTN
ncbi:MAG: TlpA family protein disulfide reductase [Chitinophagaceae bacterium]|nr:TlpA family protein disulfide reductase [Chitinophagaceae bacterium]